MYHGQAAVADIASYSQRSIAEQKAAERCGRGRAVRRALRREDCALFCLIFLRLLLPAHERDEDAELLELT